MKKDHKFGPTTHTQVKFNKTSIRHSKKLRHTCTHAQTHTPNINYLKNWCMISYVVFEGYTHKQNLTKQVSVTLKN